MKNPTMPCMSNFTNKPRPLELSPDSIHQWTTQIKQWACEYGFDACGITDCDLTQAADDLKQWLDHKFHGDMHYMEKHGTKRYTPAELVPGTVRVISVRLNYLSRPTSQSLAVLHNPLSAYISSYALGRDYHKVMRNKLKKLANHIQKFIPESQYRVFSDSAPVLEKPLAAKAGLGWQGKHSILLDKAAGSWFFLGEIYTNIPLEIDHPTTNHCGSCSKCMSVCPTQAIVAPYQLDARRCISYLTIEFKGSIPLELRPLIGNRIFGCDDCQLYCPWNRFATLTEQSDFQPRHTLDNIQLIELFLWSEQQFLTYTEGSAIRRCGYIGWLRNIAIALGNAPTTTEVITALQQRLNYPSALVKEHVIWALEQHSIEGTNVI